MPKTDIESETVQKILRAATETQEEHVIQAMIQAGLFWVCGCGWRNWHAAKKCSGCGKKSDTCSSCGGAGRVQDDLCRNCNGSGRV